MVDIWNVSFHTSGETLSKIIKLTKDLMDDIINCSSCEEEKLYLSIIQDENSLFLDITEKDNERIDLSDFHEGKFKFYILNEDAKKVKIKIDWN